MNSNVSRRKSANILVTSCCGETIRCTNPTSTQWRYCRWQIHKREESIEIVHGTFLFLWDCNLNERKITGQSAARGTLQELRTASMRFARLTVISCDSSWITNSSEHKEKNSRTSSLKAESHLVIVSKILKFLDALNPLNPMVHVRCSDMANKTFCGQWSTCGLCQ